MEPAAKTHEVNMHFLYLEDQKIRLRYVLIASCESVGAIDKVKVRVKVRRLRLRFVQVQEILHTS